MLCNLFVPQCIRAHNGTAESLLNSMHTIVYVVLTQPYSYNPGVWTSKTMACILISCLRVHTTGAEALIFVTAVVQGKPLAGLHRGFLQVNKKIKNVEYRDGIKSKETRQG